MAFRLSVLLVLFSAVSFSQDADWSVPSDLTAFAHDLSGSAKTDLEKAENILQWLGDHCSWLSTDYQKRTVEQILERKGGNCFELAKVFMDLIKREGIRHRQIAEVNIQPISDGRQRSAEGRVKEAGFRMSVFGRQHNDHRWVEIYDERTDSWVPADPSMGVIGTEAWLKARVWFGERMTIDTSITNDMFVPISIFVVDTSLSFSPSRSTHYLVDEFDRLYGGRLSGLPSWASWKRQVVAIEPYVRDAFMDKQDLHRQADKISELWQTYSSLRLEWEASEK